MSTHQLLVNLPLLLLLALNIILLMFNNAQVLSLRLGKGIFNFHKFWLFGELNFTFYEI